MLCSSIRGWFSYNMGIIVYKNYSRLVKIWYNPNNLISRNTIKININTPIFVVISNILFSQWIVV